jgi:hypothetical protein
MLTAVLLIGVLIVLVCAYGLADTKGLIGLIMRFSGKGGYLLAVAARLLIGAAAILGAPVSRLPFALYVVGGIALMAAAALVFMGQDGYRKLIARIAGMSPVWQRTMLAFGMLFGASLVWITGVI